MKEKRQAYYRWLTQKGQPRTVELLRFVGYKGWQNHIERKEYQGKLYIGEVWECRDEDGHIDKYTFRSEYEGELEILPNNRDCEIVDLPNSHTDGIEAYLTGNVAKRDNTQLLRRNQQLKDRIATLDQWIKEINDTDDPRLKLGIHLYLRKLETPCMQTSREWKVFCKSNKYINHLILDTVKAYEEDLDIRY